VPRSVGGGGARRCRSPVLAALLSSLFLGTAVAACDAGHPARTAAGGAADAGAAGESGPGAAPAPPTAAGGDAALPTDASGGDPFARPITDGPRDSGSEPAGIPSPAEYITGLTLTNIERVLERHGVACVELEPATGLLSWRCSGVTRDGQVAYDVTVDGADQNRISMVTALVTQYARPDRARSERFLRDLATLPWKGSEPESARSWVAASLPGAAPVIVETRIGHAQLIIGGSEESVTLDIAAPSADVG
jgi:hypothetical protein